MNYANNKGVQFVVMVGEDEIESGLLTIKDMITGDQDKMNISEFIKKLS
jgi:histidyl-tRNA synthetase